MFEYLDKFNVEKVEVLSVREEGKDFKKIELFEINSSGEKIISVPLLVIRSYFRRFLYENISDIFDEIKNIVHVADRQNSVSETDIILSVVSKYFKEYILEYEIEIFCELEKERSPYYQSPYQDKFFELTAESFYFNFKRIGNLKSLPIAKNNKDCTTRLLIVGLMEFKMLSDENIAFVQHQISNIIDVHKYKDISETIHYCELRNVLCATSFNQDTKEVLLSRKSVLFVIKNKLNTEVYYPREIKQLFLKFNS